MTKREFYDKFIPDSMRVSYLQGIYHAELRAQLEQWAPGASADKLIERSIDRFLHQLAEYHLETDCHVALIGCLRDILLEEINQGHLQQHQCAPKIWACYQARVRTGPLPEKQLDQILSQFSRKLFDYYTQRYFYLWDIPEDPRLEKKLAYHFQGKGRTDTFYDLYRFHRPEYTADALASYAGDISPYFLRQIGTGKTMIAHPDTLPYGRIQYEVNKARMALPVVLIMFLIVLILSILSKMGKVPF